MDIRNREFYLHGRRNYWSHDEVGETGTRHCTDLARSSFVGSGIHPTSLRCVRISDICISTFQACELGILFDDGKKLLSDVRMFMLTVYS